MEENNMPKMNAVGWFDIYVDDMERAVAFYQTVLGVTLEKIEDSTGKMHMMGFPSDEKAYGASGALSKEENCSPGVGGTTVYFSAEDCAVEEARVADAGGKVIRSKFSIGEHGWVVVCQDTEGNVFGIHSMK